MAKTDFRSVGEYIAAQPKGVQPALRQVRRIIRRAVPSAAEYLSYRMPAYKVAGVPFLCLAGWKRHYSLYPANNEMAAAFKGALAPYRSSTGTLRFPLSEPVPARLIERVAKFRARQAVRRRRARLSTARRPA